MSPGGSAPGPEYTWQQFYPPALLAIPTVVLAFLGTGLPVLPTLAVIAGIAISAYLRTLRESWAVDSWALPALAVTGLVAVLAGATLQAELLAAAAALAALYWIAMDPPGASLPRHPASGLLLPGLSVSLAISVTLFLPAGPALVGVASVILVALFMGLAAVLGGWSGDAPTDGL